MPRARGPAAAADHAGRRRWRPASPRRWSRSCSAGARGQRGDPGPGLRGRRADRLPRQPHREPAGAAPHAPPRRHPAHPQLLPRRAGRGRPGRGRRGRLRARAEHGHRDGTTRRRAVETLLEYRCEGLILLGSRLSRGRPGPAGQDRPGDPHRPQRRAAGNVAVVRSADDVGLGLARRPPGRPRAPPHRARGRRPDGRSPTDRRRGYRAAMRPARPGRARAGPRRRPRRARRLASRAGAAGC